MFEEDDDKPKSKKRVQPLVLDMLGVGELQDYIAELRVEIGRAEAEIARKESHRSSADAFFRRP